MAMKHFVKPYVHLLSVCFTWLVYMNSHALEIDNLELPENETFDMSIFKPEIVEYDDNQDLDFKTDFTSTDTPTASPTSPARNVSGESVGSMMILFCPYGYYCQGNRTIEPITKPLHEPCCKDCSCDDECGSNVNDTCCFPPSNDVIPSQYTECISIGVHRREIFVSPHYYMVSACPDNLYSSDEGLKITAELCEDNKAFLSLVPVFSKRTHAIYRNKYCAECHNASDVIIYYPNLICPDGEEDSMYDITKNRLPSNCDVYFKYPGNPADVQHHRCCPRTFDFVYLSKMPYPLTQPHVISLCENGYYSPYKTQILSIVDYFPNIFCAICSSNTTMFAVYDDCPKIFGMNNAVTMDTQISLLDTNVLEDFANQDADEHKHVHQEACQELTSGGTECREILCPSDQYYKTNGECIYVADGWVVKQFVVSLKLTSVNNTTICALENFLQDKQELYSFLMNSWPNTWSIARAFFQTSACKYLTQKSIPYIVVIMKLPAKNGETKRQELVEIIAEVKIMVSEDWHIDMNGSPIRLKSQFLDFEVTNGDATAYMVNDITLISQHVYQSENASLEINKLHYCNQITLKQSEYVLYKMRTPGLKKYKVLYLKQSEKVLLPKQFRLHMGAGETYIPTVCLTDTSFKKRLKSICIRVHYTTVTIFIAMLSVVFMIDQLV